MLSRHGAWWVSSSQKQHRSVAPACPTMVRTSRSPQAATATPAPPCQTHWPKLISGYVSLALSRLTTHFLVSTSPPSLSETLHLAETTQEKLSLLGKERPNEGLAQDTSHKHLLEVVMEK